MINAWFRPRLQQVWFKLAGDTPRQGMERLITFPPQVRGSNADRSYDLVIGGPPCYCWPRGAPCTRNEEIFLTKSNIDVGYWYFPFNGIKEYPGIFREMEDKNYVDILTACVPMSSETDRCDPGGMTYDLFVPSQRREMMENVSIRQVNSWCMPYTFLT